MANNRIANGMMNEERRNRQEEEKKKQDEKLLEKKKKEEDRQAYLSQYDEETRKNLEADLKALSDSRKKQEADAFAKENNLATFEKDYQAYYKNLNDAFTKAQKGEYVAPETFTALEEQGKEIQNRFNSYKQYLDMTNDTLSQTQRKGLADMREGLDNSQYGVKQYKGFFGSFDDADSYYQYSDDVTYGDKYRGSSYADVQDAIGKTEGREKDWLTKNADSYLSSDSAQKEIDNLQEAQKKEKELKKQLDEKIYLLTYAYKRTHPGYTQKQLDDYVSQNATVQQLREELKKYEGTAERIKKLGQIKTLAERNEKYQEYQAIPKVEDFAEVAAKGQAVKNPTTEEITKYETAMEDAIRNPYKYTNEDGMVDYPEPVVIKNKLSYYRENPFGLDPAMIPDGATHSGYAELIEQGKYDKHWDYLKPEEENTYYYLLAKDEEEGTDRANEYLDFMTNVLNERAGAEIAQALKDVPTLFKPSAFFWSSIGSGLSNTVKGWENAGASLSGDTADTSALQYGTQQYKSTLPKPLQLLYGAGEMVGQLAPTMLLNTALGAVQAPTAAIRAAGALSIGTSSYGNAYKQAIDSGYSVSQAKTYGTLVGISEATLETLLGGAGNTLGVGEEALVKKIKNAVQRKFGRVALIGAVKVGAEVTEEEIQAFLEPYFKTLVMNEEYDAPAVEELLETAIITMISTGVLEGPSIIYEASLPSAKDEAFDQRYNIDGTAKTFLRAMYADDSLISAKIIQFVKDGDTKGAIKTLDEGIRNYKYAEEYMKRQFGKTEDLSTKISELETLKKAIANGRFNAQAAQTALTKSSPVWEAAAGYNNTVVKGLLDGSVSNKKIESTVLQSKATKAAFRRLTGIDIDAYKTLSAKRQVVKNAAEAYQAVTSTEEYKMYLDLAKQNETERSTSVYGSNVAKMGDLMRDVQDRLGEKGRQQTDGDKTHIPTVGEAVNAITHAAIEKAKDPLFFAGVTSKAKVAPAEAKVETETKAETENTASYARELGVIDSIQALVGENLEGLDADNVNKLFKAAIEGTASLNAAEKAVIDSLKERFIQADVHDKKAQKEAKTHNAEVQKVINGVKKFRTDVATVWANEDMTRFSISDAEVSKRIEFLNKFFEKRFGTKVESFESGNTFTDAEGNVISEREYLDAKRRGEVVHRYYTRGNSDADNRVVRLAKDLASGSVTVYDARLGRMVTKRVGNGPGMISAQNAVDIVVMHEAFHQASATTDKKIVKDVISYIADTTKDDAYEIGNRLAGREVSESAQERWNALRETYIKFEMQEGKLSRKAAETKVNDDYLYEEIAADYVGSLMENKEIAEVFYAEQPSLWKRIIDAVKRFFGKLPKDSARARAAQDLANRLQRIAEKEYGRNPKLSFEAKPKAETDTKTETKTEETEPPLTNFEEGVVNTESGEPAVAVEGDGSVRASISTYEDSGRDILAEYLNERVSKTGLSEQDAADILSSLDEIYDICNGMKDEYETFGAWSEAKVETDKNGNPVFSVIKANGDYAMNLDFSLVCKKRRALDAVFNRLVEMGRITDFDLGQEQIVKINDIIRDHGFEVACALCFVDAKRFRQAKVADDFVTMYNSLVRSLDKNKVGIDSFNFGGDQTVSPVADGIHTLPDSELDFTNIDKVLNGGKTGTVIYKIAQHLKDNPQDRRLVARGDFMSSEGFGEVKKRNPEILSLYNSKKGSAGPKSAFGDVQYLNDILSNKKFDVEKAYDVGGVRIQSFSDYVARLVFDYTQMVADLAAKGLPAHAYTKEVLFVKQFGLTGIKINMSLIPAIGDGRYAGLNADGSYAWAKESFPLDEAYAIQADAEYGKNCGTIAVGVSDVHIWKMLDDPAIRMVIPYHKSGINPIVAHMMNIGGFTDYTSVQNTRYRNGKKLNKADMSQVPDFNVLMHREGLNAVEASRRYVEWCEERGYLPKFHRFAYKTVNGERVFNENYYKFLEDFTTMVDGVYHPQEAVKMVFPNKDSAFGSMAELIKSGLEEDAVTAARLDADVDNIVNEIVEVLSQPVEAAPKKSKAKKGETKGSVGEEVEFDESEYDLSVDNYTEKQYNDFGWARVSRALTKTELDDLYSKIQEKGALKKFPQSGYGEAIVEVNDGANTTLGVDNVLVFVTGTKNHPQIKKVIRFVAETETEMETIKEKLYERGAFSYTYYSFLKQYGFAREYGKRSAINYSEYQENARRRSGRGDSNAVDRDRGLLRDGRGTVGETSRIQEENVKTSTKASVSAEMDAEYLTEIEQGNTVYAGYLVDVAARRAGYTKRMFHETDADHIHVFDISRGDHGANDSETPYGIFTKTSDKNIGLGSRQMALYVKANKTLYVKDRSDVKNKIPALVPYYDEIARIDKRYGELADKWEDAELDALQEWIEEHPDVDMDEVYPFSYIVEKKPADIDYPKYHNAFNEYKRVMEEWSSEYNTVAAKCKDIITRYLRDNGYDSMYFEVDGGSGGRQTDSLILLDPEQVKSAAPITYDDNGDVIPLSERFNPEKSDVRYSVSEEMDSDGNALSVDQAEFFRDSKVRDADGNLLKVRHGTDAEFDIFDFAKTGKNGRAEGYGFYFSDDPEITSKYGSKQKEVYLDIKKPLYNRRKTVTKAEMIRLTNALIDFDLEKYADDGLTWQDSFLSNYVMTYDMSRAAAVREFVNAIWDNNDNDQELVLEVAMADGRTYGQDTMKEFYDVLTDSIGYDGIIAEWDHQDGTSNVYVTFRPGQSKYVTNKTPSGNPDMRYSVSEEMDAEYLTAVENGDMKTAQRIVDDAAKRAGYNSPRLYHGTYKFGFTEFDFKNARSRMAVYTTNDAEVAKTYTSNPDIRTKVSDRAGINYDQVENADNLQLMEMAKKYLGEDYRIVTKPSQTATESQTKEYRSDGRIMEGVSDTALANDTDVSFTNGKETISRINLINAVSQKLFSGVYELYGKMENPLIVDAGGANWHSLDGSIIGKSKTVTTKQIVSYAAENNYDGVIFRNIVDMGDIDLEGVASDVHVFLREGALKSADAVTYDDNGNIIPPSERFNEAKKDIRWSVTEEMESSYLDAVERGDMIEAQRLADKAAKAAGFDSPRLFHGTPSFGFTEFDFKRTKGRSWVFATDDADVANTYTFGGEVRTRLSDRADITIDEIERASDQKLLEIANKYLDGDFKIEPTSIRKTNSQESIDMLLEELDEYVDVNETRIGKEGVSLLRQLANDMNAVKIAEDISSLDKAYKAYESTMKKIVRVLGKDKAKKVASIVSVGTSSAYRNIKNYYKNGEESFTNGEDAYDRNGLIFLLSKKLYAGVYALYGKMENPLIIEGNGVDWNEIDGSLIGQKGQVTTNEVVAYAKKRHYDGVIFRDIVDTGDGSLMDHPYDVYVYLKEGALKSADPVTYDDNGNVIPLSERFNTKKKDIRWSVAEESTEDSLSYEGVEKELSRLREKYIDLRGELSTSHGTSLDAKVVRDKLKGIISSYESSATIIEVEEAFKDLWRYAYQNVYVTRDENGNIVKTEKVKEVDNAEIDRRVKAIAQTIFDKAVDVSDTFKEYGHLVKVIHDASITINDDVKSAFDGGWNDFRRSNFGRIGMRNSTDGTSNLDVFYRGLAEQYPELFNEDTTNPAEQLKQIAEVSQTLREEGLNPQNIYGIEGEAVLQSIENDIMSTFYQADQKLNFAAKAKQRERAAKEKGRRDVSAEKARGDFRVAEQDLADQMFYGKKIAELRKKYEKNLGSVIERFETKISDRSEAQMARYQKKRVEKLGKELAKRLAKPTKDKHVMADYEADVYDLLRRITWAGKTQADASVDSAVNGYLSMIENRKGEKVGKPVAGIGFSESLKADIQEFDFKPMDAMDSAELHKLNELLRRATFEVNNADKLFHSNESASVAATKAIEEFQASRRINEKTGKVETHWKWFHDMLDLTIDPETFFHNLGVQEMTDAFYRIADDQNVYAQNVRMLSDRMREIVGDDGVPTEWREDTFDIVTERGRTIHASVSQLMSFYLLSKQADSRKCLLSDGGGAVFAQTEKRGHIVGGLKERTINDQVFLLTENDLDKMEAKLATEFPEAKSVADKISELLNTTVSDMANEVSLAIEGYRKYTIPDYFPMMVFNGNESNEAEKNLDVYLSKHYTTVITEGLSRDRTEGSNKQMIVSDIFTVVDRHLLAISTYNAYKKDIVDMNRILHTKTDLGTSFASRLSLAEGTKRSKLIEYIRTFMLEVQNGQIEANEPDAPSEKLFRHYKSAAVAANLSVVAKQPISIVRALPEFSNQTAIKMLLSFQGANSKALREEMIQHSGLAQMKAWGFSENANAKSFNQLYDKNALTVKEKVDNFTSSFAEEADMATWTRIWVACKAETNTIEEATKKFNEVIRKTQVVNTATTTSAASKYKGAWKYMLAFKNEPLKSFNYLRAAIHDARVGKQGAKAHLAKVVGSSFLNTVLVAAVTTMFTMFRDEEEEDLETMSKLFLENVLGDILGNLTIFTGDIVTSVIDVVTGNSQGAVERLDLAGLLDWTNDVANIVYMAVKDETDRKDTWAKALYNLASSTSRITGIPLGNVLRDARGIGWQFVNSVDDPVMKYNFTSFWYNAYGSDNATVKAKFRDILTDALDEGDYKGFDEVQKNLRAKGFSTSEISKAVANSDRLYEAWCEGPAVLKAELAKAEEYTEILRLSDVLESLKSRKNGLVNNLYDAIRLGDEKAEETAREAIMNHRDVSTQRKYTERDVKDMIDKKFSTEINDMIKEKFTGISADSEAYDRAMRIVMKEFKHFGVTEDEVKRRIRNLGIRN